MKGKRPIYTCVHNIDGTLVVARDIKDAIDLYMKVYPNSTIKSIELLKGNWDDTFGLAICGSEDDPVNGVEMSLENRVIERIETEINKIREHDLDEQVGTNSAVIRGLNLAKWIIEEEMKK